MCLRWGGVMGGVVDKAVVWIRMGARLEVGVRLGLGVWLGSGACLG